jgi:hypothetical protein
MIEVNKLAFSNLINQLTATTTLQVADGKRFIETKGIEKDWLKSAEIKDTLLITPDIRLILILFQEESYIAVIGGIIDNSNLDSVIIQEVDTNAGIITLLLSDAHLKLKKRASYLEFYDKILFQHLDQEYIGNDYSEILEYLEPIQLYHLPENSIIRTHILNRTASYVFSKNPNELVLDFSEDVADLISDLSIMGSDNISYKSILNCLFSNTYRHAFLELYRLVERLFPISYLKEFHQRSYSTLSFLDFVAELENVTSWRPKEDEAVYKIFNETKQSTIVHFDNFIKSSAELTGRDIPKLFYGLRNSIVHFRANHSEYDLNSEQWNLLLMATIYLLDEQYSINSKTLT